MVTLQSLVLNANEALKIVFALTFLQFEKKTLRTNKAITVNSEHGMISP
jgi:hypothetical protein